MIAYTQLILLRCALFVRHGDEDYELHRSVTGRIRTSVLRLRRAASFPLDHGDMDRE